MSSLIGKKIDQENGGGEIVAVGVVEGSWEILVLMPDGSLVARPAIRSKVFMPEPFIGVIG